MVPSCNLHHDSSLILVQVKEWVIEQTRERIGRQLEADELAYQERLLAARKREAAMRRAARARVLKKPVWFMAYCIVPTYTPTNTNTIPRNGVPEI